MPKNKINNMKKLTIILGILIIATTVFFLFQPQPIGTGTRTKMVYIDRENNFSAENTFTATTTLENGFVSTSTPTLAGQIIGLDSNGSFPLPLVSVATEYLVTSNDGKVSTSSTNYVKVKEIQFNAATGTARIKFDISNNSCSDSRISYGRIYINGVAAGTERTTKDTCNPEAVVNFSEDLSVNKGDLIQLYIKTNYIGSLVIADDFRLYYSSMLKANNININNL